MSRILRLYKNISLKYPTSSQALQTGLLMGCGDLIAQIFIEKTPLQKLDILRTGQFTFVGTFFVGPSLIVWYGTMDRYFGSKGKVVALKKVLTDQLLFAPIFIGAIMFIVNLIRSNSFKESQLKLENDYVDVLKNNYKLWPAVQLLNFYLIPLSLQVITVQIVAIFWNTYLSWKMNQSKSSS